MISNIETNTPGWSWDPSRTETKLLDKDNLKVVDAGEGKAWTTATGPDISINRQPNTFYYYEIKVEFCNVSNSIKIVFGLMSKRYLDRILEIKVGEIGSLRGSSPFGYFKEFGIGSICYFANGTVSQDGFILTAQKAKPYTTNDRIGMLIDTNNSNVAFFKNGELQTSFINILNSFQSSPSNKTFSIYPSVSLIKENSVSIIKDPTIPPFFYDTNTLIQKLSSIDLNSENSNTPSATATTTTTTTTTTTNNNNNVNKPTETPTKQYKQYPNTNDNKDIPDPNNNCPVCGISFKSIGKDWASINKHIDECLTFNLLDKETSDPKRPENVKCPYCRKSILTVEFIYHCNDKHFLENHHSHKCPLCSEKTSNLISHLSKSHIKVPQKQVGVGYSTSILEQDLGEQECAICLEEFYQGQEVARLECWCIFHTNCILAYITKSKKCPVHN
ncbi:hypothetical protein DICPUDRAFT_97086 [Dictyostelium purpureum]|uniref:RING-type E3 ubiquitin transferase n=1 Tax=Dictyostelium purpureum TaxID=5786 RepID=F0ZDS1_DICPU|nr:uncharacterized protein DICPUDRAFT_97086 [Dictyostelium purpureum]EGC37916.1 hypothetical protein DICPUDRAFT_97086 [Dictyostelium purpureum]|eukprot:XP_003285576.1 hypothetical protein DICPUDRAFT_97086 [Dictyostelium purpureum]